MKNISVKSSIQESIDFTIKHFGKLCQFALFPFGIIVLFLYVGNIFLFTLEGKLKTSLLEVGSMVAMLFYLSQWVEYCTNPDASFKLINFSKKHWKSCSLVIFYSILLFLPLRWLKKAIIYLGEDSTELLVPITEILTSSVIGVAIPLFIIKPHGYALKKFLPDAGKIIAGAIIILGIPFGLIIGLALLMVWLGGETIFEAPLHEHSLIFFAISVELISVAVFIVFLMKRYELLKGKK